jgi:Protein of unknown function (DUF1553)/Protein of unknown function (DUF1549)/Planctomycete cytochrome C
MARTIYLVGCFAVLPLSGIRAAAVADPAWVLLQARCIKCHSGEQAAAKLDMRTRAGVLQGGLHGPALVAGAAAKSLLLERVQSGQMPPGGPRLSADEIRQIGTWIDAGASVPEQQPHWAFQPPHRPRIPAVKERARVRTAVDSFLLAELERKHLTFSPEAGRATLIRRAYFDLIGLPPTPADVDAFVADKSADAYERLVEHLLASPQYGERWARHWLDIAGYADSEGGEAADVVRPNAWRYRDYVIRAFNTDKPYDQFVREQLAGDELSEYWKYEKLPPRVVEQLEATGYLRMAVDGSLDTHPKTLNLDYLWKALFDTQQIVASSLLGVTMQCARCHDHKYEPVSQRDYYRMEAIFAGAFRPDGPFLVSADRKIVEATAGERAAADKVNKLVEPAIKALQDLRKARLAQYRAKHPKGEEASEAQVRKEFPEFDELAKQLDEEIKTEESNRVNLPSIRALYDVDAAAPETHVLHRGDYTAAKGETVVPGVPHCLEDTHLAYQPVSVEGHSTGRRLAFANWLTGAGHPLTARVMVNRIWSHHFGTGIVPSLDNFGRSGEPPSNPALLDWLATEFVREGWSIKKMHRLIVNSSAYRQDSRKRAAAAAVDPDNKLLWRMNPRRTEAEAVRDAILSAAGTLDLKMYGEPVASKTKPNGEVVPENDAAGGRRSIYLIVRRSAPQTTLNVLGAPVMELNCARRTTYNSASQALMLMNSEFIAAQAEHFARRVLREAPPGEGHETQTVEHAFRLALERRPTASEMDRLRSFLHTQAAHYESTPAADRDVRVYADLCQALLSSNEFLYID